MPLVVKDRVQETSTTTGTGTITLAGAVSGFQSFSVIGNANTTYYAIVGGTEWEVGLGTYTSSGTLLSRDTILESSNSGSAVNFSAGTKNVFVTYPAEKSLYLDVNNTFSLSGTNGITNATWTTAGRPSAPSTGQMGYNTTIGVVEYYDGSNWKFVANTGNIASYSTSYLIVAGGGGGGWDVGGGGGAGGLLTGSTTLLSGTTYSFTVGAGGSGSGTLSVVGSNGENSTAFSLTATGGGGGGSYIGGSGASGGSGGGGAGYGATTTGGSGTSGQGFAGGNSVSGYGTGATGGGGGGSSSVGAVSANDIAGFANGGSGTASSITGSSVTYAAGGKGSGDNWTGMQNGAANTGNGGDGAGNPNTGKNGGSGVVIISLPTVFYTGTTTGSPTITTSGSNTIIKFTASGSYTA